MRILVKVYDKNNDTWNHMQISFENIAKLEEIIEVNIKVEIEGDKKTISDKATFDKSKVHWLPEKSVEHEGNFESVRYTKHMAKANVVQNGPTVLLTRPDQETIYGSNINAPHMQVNRANKDGCNQVHMEPILAYDFQNSQGETSTFENTSTNNSTTDKSVHIHDSDVFPIITNGKTRKGYYKRNSPYVYYENGQQVKLSRMGYMTQSQMKDNIRHYHDAVLNFARRRMSIPSNGKLTRDEWKKAVEEFEQTHQGNTSIITFRPRKPSSMSSPSQTSTSPRSVVRSVVDNDEEENVIQPWAE